MLQLFRQKCCVASWKAFLPYYHPLKHCYAIKCCCCKLKKHVATMNWRLLFSTNFSFVARITILATNSYATKIWEISSDWSKLALQHSANFLTAKMNWKQKLSEGQKCEYRSSITNRSTSCGTTILFSPNQNVQSRHPSTSSPLLTSLTKAHLFSDVLEDLEELHADFCPFPSLFTSWKNAVRTLCKIHFKLSVEQILNLQRRVSIAIAFMCLFL